jgi:Flp pilus assembly protein CpaB
MPLVAIGVILVVGSALAVAMWTTSASQRVPVLVAARDIPEGAVIARDDLATANVAAGSNVASIAATSKNKVIGQVASVRVGKGSMLSNDQFDQDGVVGADEAVVSVRVAPGDLPTPDLRDGEFVMVVRVSGPGGGDATPVHVATAKVMHLEFVDDAGQGETSVSLLVPASTARQVADASASNEARLVLVSATEIGEGDDLSDIAVQGSSSTDGGG